MRYKPIGQYNHTHSYFVKKHHLKPPQNIILLFLMAIRSYQKNFVEYIEWIVPSFDKIEVELVETPLSKARCEIAPNDAMSSTLDPILQHWNIWNNTNTIIEYTRSSSKEIVSFHGLRTMFNRSFRNITKFEEGFIKSNPRSQNNTLAKLKFSSPL